MKKKREKRVNLSLSDEDYNFLKKFGDRTGDNPTSIITRIYFMAKNKELVTKMGKGFFVE